MSRLIFIAAVLALVSACSSMSGSRTANTNSMSRTTTMGAPGSIGTLNPMGEYGGGPN